MRLLIAVIAASAALSITMTPAKAQSFSCMEESTLNAAEQRVCKSPWLGAMDERLDSWYRRALERARYFDQTSELRAAQRSWIASRDQCGGSFWCIRRHYSERIRTLRSYVEHV